MFAEMILLAGATLLSGEGSPAKNGDPVIKVTQEATPLQQAVAWSPWGATNEANEWLMAALANGASHQEVIDEARRIIESHSKQSAQFIAPAYGDVLSGQLEQRWPKLEDRKAVKNWPQRYDIDTRAVSNLKALVGHLTNSNTKPLPAPRGKLYPGLAWGAYQVGDASYLGRYENYLFQDASPRPDEFGVINFEALHSGPPVLSSAAETASKIAVYSWEKPGKKDSIGLNPHYAIVSGWMLVEGRGEYRIGVQVDNCGMVWIDGQPAVYQMNPHEWQTPKWSERDSKSGLFLEAGYHSVLVYAIDNGGDNNAANLSLHFQQLGDSGWTMWQPPMFYTK